MPPTALLGLFLGRVQAVQKKQPMKCAGVAGRLVRATAADWTERGQSPKQFEEGVDSPQWRNYEQAACGRARGGFRRMRS